MRIRIRRSGVAALVLAAVLAPSAALASHVFGDVDDSAFYSGPVAWAFENGITTGTTATEFAPLDDVSRGESVTFLERYDTNIVRPDIDRLDGEVVALEGEVAALDGEVAALDGEVAALGNSGMAAVQETTTGNSISIAATTATMIEQLVIGGTGTVDVVLSGHLQIENLAATQGRFEVSIRLDDCDGVVLGLSTLRTGVSTSTYVSSTVAITGFADDIAGGSTIALCADKVFAGAANGTAFLRGLTAMWS